jgi:hypothetical protein
VLESGIGVAERARRVWYTRPDELSCEEIIPCGRDGAYLPGVLRADAENECAKRHADQGAFSVQ